MCERIKQKSCVRFFLFDFFCFGFTITKWVFAIVSLANIDTYIVKYIHVLSKYVDIFVRVHRRQRHQAQWAYIQAAVHPTHVSENVWFDESIAQQLSLFSRKWKSKWERSFSVDDGGGGGGADAFDKYRMCTLYFINLGTGRKYTHSYIHTHEQIPRRRSENRIKERTNKQRRKNKSKIENGQRENNVFFVVECVRAVQWHNWKKEHTIYVFFPWALCVFWRLILGNGYNPHKHKHSYTCTYTLAFHRCPPNENYIKCQKICSKAHHSSDHKYNRLVLKVPLMPWTCFRHRHTHMFNVQLKFECLCTIAGQMVVARMSYSRIVFLNTIHQGCVCVCVRVLIADQSMHVTCIVIVHWGHFHPDPLACKKKSVQICTQIIYRFIMIYWQIIYCSASGVRWDLILFVVGQWSSPVHLSPSPSQMFSLSFFHRVFVLLRFETCTVS